MSLDILNNLIETAVNTQSVDMTETSTGGGGGLMPEGYAMARVVTYIELGMHPQEFNGKAKAPAPEVKLGFKLFGGPDDCYEGRFMSTFDTALSNNEKSNCKKMYDRLNWAGDMKHLAQSLSRGYLLPIKQVTNKQGKVTNRIDVANILPPIDPVSKSNYPIPEVDAADLKYFFFDAPTKETWDGLFVDGKYDDGGSKNKIQEKILTALNYPGSALEQLISGVVLPNDMQDPAPAAPEVPAAPQPVAPVTPPTPVAPVAPAAPVAPVMPAMPAAPVVPS